MSFGMETCVFLAYAGGLLLIYIFGKLLLFPVKILCRIALNSIIGGVFIFLVDFFLADKGIWVPLNIWNGLIIGVLGIPGAVALLLVFNL